MASSPPDHKADYSPVRRTNRPNAASTDGCGQGDLAGGVEVALATRTSALRRRPPWLANQAGSSSRHRQAVALEPDELTRIVRQQTHTPDPELAKNLGADAIVPLVGLESESLVSLDDVVALVLKLVGPDLVGQSDAASFLVQLQQDAPVLNRDYDELVLARETAQLRDPRHGPVLVHNFADDAGRLETGDARQVDRGLRLAGPDEHAAVPGPQRKHVTGPSQVRRSRRRIGDDSGPS